MDTVQPQGATELLQDILKQQEQLIAEKVRENKLEEKRQAQQATFLAQAQKKLDLKASQLALDKQAENRREQAIAQLQDRLARQSEFVDNVVKKLVTADDALADTVQRVISAIHALTSAQIDNEKALYALLTKNIDDMTEAKTSSPGRRKELYKQELMLKYEETLHNLKLQAAAHGPLDIPIKLQNEIELVKSKIEELFNGK